jgi:hypothetical protein
MGNLRYLLLSRKFWLSVVGLLSVIYVAVTGREPLPDEAIVEAIVTLVGVLVIAIGVEDGLSGRQ